MSSEELKKELIKIFQKEIDIRREFQEMREENLLFLQFSTLTEEKKTIEILENNLKMMDRIEMKCVTFGSTSNGKSSILNGLLGIDAFPSGYGQATSCFVNVQGCEDSRGYIMDKDDQKLDFEQIKKLTDANCKGHYDIHSELKVFLPKFECEILKEGVEIWDSPGIDYSEEHNEVIRKHCQDTDVFLLVIDGCSTLSLSERKLFATINDIMTIPSIIFLVNKWDKVATDMKDIVKKQHLEKIKKTFVDDLKIYNAREEIEKRIFFVSARKIGLKDNDGVVFERFKEKLIDELRINATRRKLKGNMNKVLRYSQESSDILEKIKLFVDNELKKEGLKEPLQKIIDEEIKLIHDKFNDLVKVMSSRLSKDTEKQIMRNIPSKSKQISSFTVDCSVQEKLKDDMKIIYNEEILNLERQLKTRLQNLENGHQEINSLVDEYFTQFAQFVELIQRFDRVRESLLKGFFGNVDIIFNDKECVEDDLSLSTFLMIIQIKKLINCSDDTTNWEKIKNTSSAAGGQFIEILDSLKKSEPIDPTHSNGKGSGNKSNSKTKSMVDKLTSLRKNLKEIVMNKDKKDKLPIIFKGIVDILGDNLNLVMENHMKLTRSEIEEKMNECVDKYLQDQQEILEMWKRLEDKRIDKKDIADLKKKIDDCCE